MDKRKLKLLIAGILIIVFTFIVINSFKKVKSKYVFIKSQVSAKALPAQEFEPLFATKRLEVKKEEREIGWGRDPFMLQEASPERVDTIANLKLMGITIDKTAKSMVVINNELLSIGDKIGKFRVIKIFKDSVVLTDEKENFELKLK